MNPHPDALEAGDPVWTPATTLDKLRAKGAMSVKLGARQIALFLHDGQPHACNNRCPHEGYPLAEGRLDGECVLTCHWHNWRFDLRSGDNLYGGDRLRIYPVRVDADQVLVDLREPPAAQRQAQALGQLDAAMTDNDRPRIARELARCEKTGATAEQVLLQAIAQSHDRFRYGMTHAHAGAEAWLRLRDAESDPARRLACLAEALGYLSFETLREPVYPYAQASAPWDAGAFLAAVETQDEAAALARIHGALDSGQTIEDLLPVLTQAALAHYSDFGHSVIYLHHLRRLVARLGPESARPLLRLWLRALVFATREDLLPDFRAYADALAQWPVGLALGDSAGANLPPSSALEGLSVKRTLAALQPLAGTPPTTLLPLLAQAAAHHLLRFDPAVAQRADNAVADNVGWLAFSHALTFAQALQALLPANSLLWPQGLLQMGLFIGRNTPYLDPARDAAAEQKSELTHWFPPEAADAAGSATAMGSGACMGLADFERRWRDQVIDHGLGLDIFPVHWLKTSLAVEALCGLGWPHEVCASLRAAQCRLLGVNFKQRHALRNAHQALAFVARED